MRAHPLLLVAVVAVLVSTLPRATSADCITNTQPGEPADGCSSDNETSSGCECNGDGCGSGAMVSSGMTIFGSVAFVSRRRRKATPDQR
jgi:hypothetical protein